MLDDRPKPRIGALFDQAAAAWHAEIARLSARTGAPSLGAGAQLLRLVSPQGTPQNQLSEMLGLSKQAVQQSLDQLERLALIRREVDPADKRAKRVQITAAGIAALAARDEAERTAERAARDILGKKRFGQLRKALRKLS
ncbi:MAG: MarR family transcriptional regulator [Devosia sp.]